MYQFRFYGTPIAKQRPRFARVGSGVDTYNTQAKVEAKISVEAERQFAGPPIAKAFGIDMKFYFVPPKSKSKKTKEAMLSGEIPHTVKPDIDNLVKFYMDAFQPIKDKKTGLIVWPGIVKDDKACVRLRAEKRYATEAYTEIMVWPIGAQGD